MDIDALRCFLAVVETGSYTAAAQQIHRSQSAVSQKMNKLAEQTGKTLFRQVGRSLELTEDGKFLLGYARHIVSLHDDAMRQLQGNGQIVRPLTLGCPDDYAETILPKVVTLIRQCVPNLPIQLIANNSTKLKAMLSDGTLDVAIVSRSSEAAAGQYLLKSYGVWAFDGDIKKLEENYDLNGSVALILFEKSCQFHHAAVHGLSQQNINSRVVCSTNSLSMIHSLVLAGMGLTVVGECSLGQMSKLTDNNNPLPFNLPKLPSVIIEMVIAANPHPNFGRVQLLKVTQEFAELNHPIP